MPVCLFFLGEGGGGGGDQNHDHCLIVETCCDTNAAQNQPFSSVPSRLSPTNTLTLQDTTVLVKDGRLVRLHTDTTGRLVLVKDDRLLRLHTDTTGRLVLVKDGRLVRH